MTEFAKILLFLIAACIFVGVGYMANFLLAPNRPNPEKNSSYECGEEALDQGPVQFNLRFYIIGLIFLIFEVEILFLFPWATVFAEKELIEAHSSWGWFALAEAVLFVGVLALGLAYVWKKGGLEWVKTEVTPLNKEVGIPEIQYEKVNQKYS
ncbi:MAG: NADH-quinone oxidoreductase subunit A [Bacteroidota bacterium]